MSNIFKTVSLKNYNWLNKYSVVIILFVVWLSFFDKFSLVTQYRLSQTLSELEDKERDYERLLKIALEEKQTLERDSEKFAREKYLMHKENEQVIVLE